jgi:hypothetical protein
MLGMCEWLYRPRRGRGREIMSEEMNEETQVKARIRKAERNEKMQ